MANRVDDKELDVQIDDLGEADTHYTAYKCLLDLRDLRKLVRNLCDVKISGDLDEMTVADLLEARDAICALREAVREDHAEK